MEKLGLNLPLQQNQAPENTPDGAGTDGATEGNKGDKSNAQTE